MTGGRFMERGRTRRAVVGGQRGYMLVIALLVLLALASVGMLAAQTISQEIQYAGNMRQGSVAYHVTEGGAFAALAYATELGPAGLASADTGITVVDPTNPVETDVLARWGPDDLAGQGMTYFDMSTSGSFGYAGALLQSEGAGSASPTEWAPVNFEVQLRSTGLRQPMIGYGVSGSSSYCRLKYQLDTVGSVGRGPGDTNDATGTVWQQIRALIYVGPLPCEQSAVGAGGMI